MPHRNLQKPMFDNFTSFIWGACPPLPLLDYGPGWRSSARDRKSFFHQNQTFDRKKRNRSLRGDMSGMHLSNFLRVIGSVIGLGGQRWWPHIGNEMGWRSSTRTCLRTLALYCSSRRGGFWISKGGAKVELINGKWNYRRMNWGV